MGLEALREIELKKPDVLVIDMMMPNLNGLEVLLQTGSFRPTHARLYFQCRVPEPYVLRGESEPVRLVISSRIRDQAKSLRPSIRS